ncbi:capsule assembly Wzi family protein [Aliivibrio finisterrensis]|uniref:Capsule assembly Wzi family protein n=1 Tax=Aliivibrio finisterrensis TaxID=511998 RepID=A0A6N6RPS5_9GAMM|nr:capsule assembly Wzi family protein [Aliivibrio finisterrensis]KAB2823533.1 capsule assembly Wzi family protein [Aliivibrio finisterrensis]
MHTVMSHCANKKIRLTPIATALACCLSSLLVTPSAVASPWLEANDPFLRSSLVILSDSGVISSPTNQYPLRWSLFGDDITNNEVSHDVSVALAQREVRYSMNSAKLNRGQSSTKFVASNEEAPSTGFGQFSKDKWGASASYEYLDTSYAFRVTTGYSSYQGEEEIRWDDSYLSLNLGAWLFSIGTLDRWWGQGWQHNLILGSYAKAAPDISVSYIGQNKLFGVWNIETLVAKPDDAEFNYHNATRFVSKPFSFFEYGLTYQVWFDNTNSSRSDDNIKQAAVDAKLTLPSINVSNYGDESQTKVYHSVYAELASTEDTTELGALLLGWSGSVNIEGQTVRLVLESQQSTSEHKALFNANSTYDMDNSYSVALYVQMSNDHNVSLSYQQSEWNDTQSRHHSQSNTTQANYRLPAASGMVHLGLGYTQMNTTTSDDQINASLGYEFRF